MLFTTSRNAGKKLTQQAKELSKSSKGVYWPRGKKSLKKLIEEARYEGFEKLVVVGEKEGKPKLREIKITEQGWEEEAK